MNNIVNFAPYQESNLDYNRLSNCRYHHTVFLNLYFLNPSSPTKKVQYSGVLLFKA